MQVGGDKHLKGIKIPQKWHLFVRKELYMNRWITEVYTHIKKYSDEEIDVYSGICPMCNYKENLENHNLTNYKFCPNCGEQMIFENDMVGNPPEDCVGW